MLLSAMNRSFGRAAVIAPRLSTIITRPIASSPVLDKGHSKWQNIKAVKGKNDLARSQVMTTLLKKVSAAARKGGYDLKLNRELGALELEFKAKGLSLDTFKNYLQKLKDKPEQPFRFEIIGPSGSFIIVEAEAFNRTTISSALGKYMNKVGGLRLAADSSAVLAWFDEKGVVRAENVDKDGKEVSFESAEEMGIEVDCEQVDMVDGEDGKPRFEMLCHAKQVNAVEEALTKLGLIIESAETEMRPKHPISIAEADAKTIEKFYELLGEDDNVRQIFDNIQPDA